MPKTTQARTRKSSMLVWVSALSFAVVFPAATFGSAGELQTASDVWSVWLHLGPLLGPSVRQTSGGYAWRRPEGRCLLSLKAGSAKKEF